MTKETLYYVQKMKETLSLKQSQNPQYSLRAFARDIGVHPSTLSHVLNGRRGLPYKQAEEVALRLNLEEAEKKLFIESFFDA